MRRTVCAGIVAILCVAAGMPAQVLGGEADPAAAPDTAAAHAPHAAIDHAAMHHDMSSMGMAMDDHAMPGAYGPYPMTRETSGTSWQPDAARHSGLHVMAEGLYVEIETSRGPAAPGETGAILVTDLLNHAMPLIRYRIGDLGAWAAGPCRCGRGLPRLERVAGRVTDFLAGCDGRLVSGVFLATYVVAQRPSLGQVQIVQHKAGEATYRIKPGAAFDPVADVEYLRRTTREYLGDRAVVRAELVDALPAEPSGKFLFSRSTVTPDFLAPRAAAVAR